MKNSCMNKMKTDHTVESIHSVTIEKYQINLGFENGLYFVQVLFAGKITDTLESDSAIAATEGFKEAANFVVDRILTQSIELKRIDDASPDIWG